MHGWHLLAEGIADRTGSFAVLITQAVVGAAEPVEARHKKPKCVVLNGKINFGKTRKLGESMVRLDYFTATNGIYFSSWL